MTRQVSVASAALFRVGFGVAGLILVIRFFVYGWIDALLVDPAFHFKYPGFGWVEPLGGSGMRLVFVTMALAALAVALGWHHRVAALVFGAGLAYVELIDRTNYLNHYYWLVITAVVLAFLPMDRMWALSRRSEARTVPLWVVHLLRFQVGMVYFFAGVAKLNPDWLFRAEPLATWLPARSEMWLIGPLLALPATAFVMSWAGALFDLTIVAWLSFRRTRLPAYGAVVVFHTITWLLFPSIGLFPLVMSLSALIFFDPEWPERMVARFRRPAPEVPVSPIPASPFKPVWMALGIVYVFSMVVIPLRHFAIPGDVRWTSEGYHGSWHVMLSDRTGVVEFHMVDEQGRAWIEGPPTYLTDRQREVMATDPALIRQLALHMAEETGYDVSAEARLAFNGRRATVFTDGNVVLTQPGLLPASEWVVASP